MSAPPTERAGVLWGKRRSGEGTWCVRTSILARTIRFRACGDALGEVRGAPASLRRSRCWCEKKVESCWSEKRTDGCDSIFCVWAFSMRWCAFSTGVGCYGRIPAGQKNLGTPSRFWQRRLSVDLTSRCAPTSPMGMTTVWRPRVRIDVPNVGDAEKTDTSREELTKKGTKRKRAPRTKGPCEHGVKPRSNCKVCRACPHGRRRSQCKECGGSQICEHGRRRYHCKECGGVGICEHGRRRHECKECGGSQICEHGRQRYQCKECGGGSICEHGRHRYQCKECGGPSICEHGRQRHQCKECGGSQICEHGRQRHKCKECGGASICEHGRQRHQCKECGGASICEHGRRRSRCKECV
jgi:hypothetical protein